MSYYNLDENSPTIKQPKGLKVKLRPHQLTSVAAMLELEQKSCIIIDKPDITGGLFVITKSKINDVDEFLDSTFLIETNSAILADKVGSGKSYMIAALILAKNVPPAHNRFIMGTDHFSIKVLSDKENKKVNLIVVPHNLANQWESFIEKTSLNFITLNVNNDFDIFFDIETVPKMTPAKKGLVLYVKSKKKAKKHAGSKRNSILYDKKTLNMNKVNEVLENNQVIILNINRYKFFRQIFKSIKWARVIIDEMDSTMIPTSFNEFGNFNWFVTATPTAIFYKSCRRYVNQIFGSDKDLINYFTVKNKDEYVDQSVVLPKPHIYIINALLKQVVSALKDLIPQDVMRLIYAGNMKEAVVKLNCDIDTKENIAKVLTGRVETELHNLKRELEYNKELIPHDPDAHEKKN